MHFNSVILPATHNKINHKSTGHPGSTRFQTRLRTIQPFQFNQFIFDGIKMTNQAQKLYEETIRINTFECDIHQNWKPAAFFQHLTEAAGIHAARLGVGFEVMVAQNLYWVHSRMKIKFYDFPKPGDLVTIRTWPKTIQQKLFFIRDFELLDAGGSRLAAATSAWLIINATTRRMVMPGSVNLDLPAFSERFGLDEPLERIGLAQDGEERLCVQAGYSEIDLLGHVNNSRYVEWVCDAFPMDRYANRKIDWMQINYDHEIRPGEAVAIRVNPVERDPDLWAVEGINRTNQTRAFEAAVHWQR
jgi:medium-chain acyl-[acyl-carrier-protein] hydrolase